MKFLVPWNFEKHPAAKSRANGAPSFAGMRQIFEHPAECAEYCALFGPYFFYINLLSFD